NRVHVPARSVVAAARRPMRAWAVHGCVAVLVAGVFSACAPARAQAPPAIAGQVASAEEGPMEGVLVSVQKIGTPISITVVSNAHGRFTVPPAKLSPGRYSLRIRTVGYDLDRPHALTIPSPP